MLFASNLQLHKELEHEQESYNLKQLSTGETPAAAWWGTLPSKFGEDSERSPSAMGDFHWQSKHCGSFGG